jgi:hypothetical protein
MKLFMNVLLETIVGPCPGFLGDLFHVLLKLVVLGSRIQIAVLGIG